VADILTAIVELANVSPRDALQILRVAGESIAQRPAGYFAIKES
jgi:hypothetical protein